MDSNKDEQQPAAKVVILFEDSYYVQACFSQVIMGRLINVIWCIDVWGFKHLLHLYIDAMQYNRIQFNTMTVCFPF